MNIFSNIIIWDHDFLAPKDDYLGQIAINLDHAIAGVAVWYPITHLEPHDLSNKYLQGEARDGGWILVTIHAGSSLKWHEFRSNDPKLQSSPVLNCIKYLPGAMEPSMCDGRKTVFNLGGGATVSVTFDDMSSPLIHQLKFTLNYPEDRHHLSPDCQTTSGVPFRIHAEFPKRPDCIMQLGTSFWPLPDDSEFPILCAVAILRWGGKESNDHIRLSTLFCSFLYDALNNLPRRYRDYPDSFLSFGDDRSWKIQAPPLFSAQPDVHQERKVVIRAPWMHEKSHSNDEITTWIDSPSEVAKMDGYKSSEIETGLMEFERLGCQGHIETWSGKNLNACQYWVIKPLDEEWERSRICIQYKPGGYTYPLRRRTLALILQMIPLIHRSSEYLGNKFSWSFPEKKL